MRRLALLVIAVFALVGFSGTAAVASSTDDGPGILVVGGRPATENYSFLVYTSGCTGSLIKANWVVTARHCPTPSSVRVGSINRTSAGIKPICARNSRVALSNWFAGFE